MTTYEIISQGSPIVPYNLLVKFPINGMTANYTDPMVTGLTGQDRIDLFTTHASNLENVIKDNSFFSIKDLDRDVTWQETLIGVNADDPNKNDYSLAMTFSINNAEITQELQVQSDLTGQDLENFLQQAAENKRLEFMGNVPWS